jgi:hypothetical protein
MNNARAGLYGRELMTYGEIFRRAGEPDLFDKLSESELICLRDAGLMPRALCSYAIIAVRDREATAQHGNNGYVPAAVLSKEIYKILKREVK